MFISILLEVLTRFIAKKLVTKLLEEKLVRKVLAHPAIKRLRAIYEQGKKVKHTVDKLNPNHLHRHLNRFAHQQLLKSIKGTPLESTINEVLRIRKVKRDFLSKVNEYTSPNTYVKKIRDYTIHQYKEVQLDKIEIDYSALSSSWISSGVFYPNEGIGADRENLVGAMTLYLKQGRSYTYISVPYDTWNAMKKASGYRSGAGSVFWLRYLHAYRVNHPHYATKKTVKRAVEIQSTFSTLRKEGYSVIRQRAVKGKRYRYVYQQNNTNKRYSKYKKY